MIIDHMTRNDREYVLFYYSGCGSRSWMPLVRPSQYRRGRPLACKWQIGTIRIECPFCRETHTHGWAPGPRGPHCSAPRPELQEDEAFEYYIECDEEDPTPRREWEAQRVLREHERLATRGGQR